MRSPALVVASFALLFAAPIAAFASDDESSSSSQTEVRPFVGAFIPTGKQKDDLKTSILTGVQLGYHLAGPARLVGTFAWAPSKTNSLSEIRTNVYQYDAGGELAGHYGVIRPFVGVGAGARTYSLKNSSNSQTNFDGYGSLGSELAISHVGARIEARDYVSRFKGLDGLDGSSTRNDLMLAGALTFHL